MSGAPTCQSWRQGARPLGGHTRDEALRNIQEVTQLVVEELLEDGQPLPTGVTVTDEPVVAVHVA